MGFMGESWMKKSSTSTRCRWTTQFSAWGGVFRKRTGRGFSTWSGPWNWGFHAVRYTASSRKAARSRFPGDEQLNPAKSWALPAPENRLRTVWTRSFRSDRSNSPKAVPSLSTKPRSAPTMRDWPGSASIQRWKMRHAWPAKRGPVNSSRHTSAADTITGRSRKSPTARAPFTRTSRSPAIFRKSTSRKSTQMRASRPASSPCRVTRSALVTRTSIISPAPIFPSFPLKRSL